MPLVSVILTSFNHGNFIQEAIDSVLNQTFQDFELIIWDDASADNSWEIIQSYSDPRIRAFQNQQNKGPVFGINKAISEIAQGKYIAMHHSDDAWELSKLQNQVDILEANQKIGAVFTNALAIDERGAPLANLAHPYCSIFNQPNRSRYEWLRSFFLSGNALCHPSILIRKQCYTDCGLYLDMLAQLPDFDMWVRLCAKYEIHVMADRLIKFRVRDSEMNTSGNRSDTRIRSAYENYKVLQRYRTLLGKDEIFKVFPEFISYDRGEDTDPEYVLSRICLESGDYFLRNFLAIEILFDMLNNPSRKQAIEKVCGFFLKDFIAITGRYDLFSREVTANLQNAVAERDVQMDRFLTEIDVQIKNFVSDRDNQINHLNNLIVERDAQITTLNCLIAALDAQIGNPII